MIQWLPSESAFRASVKAKGDIPKAMEFYGWTTQEELLLGLYNRMNENTWVTAQVASKKKIPKPKPAKGPGEPRRTGDASAMARSLLDNQKG